MTHKLKKSLVNSLYNFFLFRNADPKGLEDHLRIIDDSDGFISSDFIGRFTESTEFLQKTNQFITDRLNITEGNIDLYAARYLKYSSGFHQGHKNQLLVTGMYRSGTSALVSLLNFSDDIFISHESFSDVEPLSWTDKSFTSDYHLRKAFPKLCNLNFNGFDSSGSSFEEISNSVYRIFPEVEICKYTSKKVLDANTFLKFAENKLIKICNSYDTFHTVGDKIPKLASLDIPLRMLSNPNLKILVMIRDPISVYKSAYEKLSDSNFNNFVPDDFVKEYLSSLNLLSALVENAPHRVVLIKFEGFFESRERIESLFRKLGASSDRINWGGIEYLIKRANLLSSNRKSQSSNLDGVHIKGVENLIELSNKLIDFSSAF